VAQLHVELVAVDSAVFSGEADLVIARTMDGDLGVLPGHAPLLGQLAEPSTVRVRSGGSERAWIVDGGFLSISDEGVTVLAESAEEMSTPVQTV
jgi:F-type H+-transporting ATPase subunit epsilon